MRGALPDGFIFGVLGTLAWDASSCGIFQSRSILLDFDHAFDVPSLNMHHASAQGVAFAFSAPASTRQRSADSSD